MYDLVGWGFIILFGALCYSLAKSSKNKVKVLRLFCKLDDNVENYIRLLMGPYIIWGLIEYLFMSSEPNFMVAKLLGLGVGLIVIPSFCYSYRIILKKAYLGLDIFIYILAVLCSQVFSFQIMKAAAVPNCVSYASLVLLLVACLSYIARILVPMNMKKLDYKIK